MKRLFKLDLVMRSLLGNRPSDENLFLVCKNALGLPNAEFSAKSGELSNGKYFMIFDYYNCSEETWLSYPELMDCRGIMFETNSPNVEEVTKMRILSRPMKKFFNWGENDLTRVMITRDMIKHVYVKSDGSLMSTYMDGDTLKLKSRFSVKSEQAMMAMDLLGTPSYRTLHNLLEKLAIGGYTVDMEFVSPNNNIVVVYPEDELIIHSVRHNSTGNTYFIDDGYIPMLSDHEMATFRLYASEEVANSQFKDKFDDDWGIDTLKIIREIQAGLVGSEGYVVHLDNGLSFKVKSDWYVGLHREMDLINNPEKLFMVVVNNQHDDLKSLVADQPLAVQKVEEMVDKVYAIAHDLEVKVKKALDIVSYAKDKNGDDDKNNRTTRKSAVDYLMHDVKNGLIGKEIFNSVMSNYGTIFDHNFNFTKTEMREIFINPILKARAKDYSR